MKLRIGYGTTGNNGIGDRLYVTSIQQTSYPINSDAGNSAYLPGETLGNKDLKWETLISTNVGLDLSFSTAASTLQQNGITINLKIY